MINNSFFGSLIHPDQMRTAVNSFSSVRLANPSIFNNTTTDQSQTSVLNPKDNLQLSNNYSSHGKADPKSGGIAQLLKLGNNTNNQTVPPSGNYVKPTKVKLDNLSGGVSGANSNVIKSYSNNFQHISAILKLGKTNNVKVSNSSQNIGSTKPIGNINTVVKPASNTNINVGGITRTDSPSQVVLDKISAANTKIRIWDAKLNALDSYVKANKTDHNQFKKVGNQSNQAKENASIARDEANIAVQDAISAYKDFANASGFVNNDVSQMRASFNEMDDFYKKIGVKDQSVWATAGEYAKDTWNVSVDFISAYYSS